MSCFATSWVPSGEPSSTIMSSQSSLLRGGVSEGFLEVGREGGLLFGEGLFEEPGYDGEVFALIVGREDDGVFVFLYGCHCSVCFL